MTFQQLQYVLEVARWGSINKAAQKLFLSQSNISSLIKELEEELGVELFKRTNRGVAITNHGKEFLNYARPLVEQKRRLEELYTRQNTEPAMYFSVSGQHYPFVVDAFLRFFQEKASERCVFHMMETDMDQVIEDVFQNRSELGILFMSELTEGFIRKELKAKGIAFHPLETLRPRIYFSKDHPLATRKSVSLEEVSGYPMIVFEQESGVGIDYAEEVALHDLKQADRIIYIKDRSTFYNIVEHTDAFSIGTGLLPPGFSSRHVISLPIEGDPQMMQLGWIKLKGKPMTEEMTRFIELTKEALEDAKKLLEEPAPL
ncbi:LysR family transcriptional regulator [Anaerotignum lactatifermentans]|uniref:LysR family transcriptional regulator n=2 Tax=Anaerotignum lactatifermentans TaxID=160404 RepID=A0ABS2G676_9FIRM|nr:LysR family transcriptional regulator [Anaerotignum lactatifermentans]MBM6828876.1 LysR family transcriptional regulator [Anaerotignum lactatifermentans]MBM6876951.1 LysR family transcriptional regulator [Anaerotignum lactatifermentans]MBM6950509.1 LysR family transcriptional regulator [Anaerotignum lactatifermentans]